MRQNIIFLILLSFVILSCKTDDDNLINTCNVTNPVENLTWLKEKIAELEQTSLYESGEVYISQANYNSNTIFILGNCCATCNTVVPVFNCAGEVIGYGGDNNFNINTLKNSIIIWKPENSICF
ncbi:hypothetical protein [uncultured Wocania sp.]|uniref:hypothetical protein n=1 Tax=uncultured Wocania sp. TaxID=2834404 RepID=UPI0030F69E17